MEQENVLIYVYGLGTYSVMKNKKSSINTFEIELKEKYPHYNTIIPVVMTGLDRKVLRTIFSPFVKRYPPFSKKNIFLNTTLSTVLINLHNGNKVTLVGHSAGGALVNRVSEELFNLFYKRYDQNKYSFLKNTPLGIIELIEVGNQEKKKMEKFDCNVTLQYIIDNLQIATVGSIWIWDKDWNSKRLPHKDKVKMIFDNIIMYNYMSISDVSKFCVGINEKWSSIDSVNGFTGFVIMKNSNSSVDNRIPFVICKCFYDNPLKTENDYYNNTNIIPICLYQLEYKYDYLQKVKTTSLLLSENIKICNQHIEMREHNDYGLLMYLLKSKNINIYHEKYKEYSMNSMKLQLINKDKITDFMLKEYIPVMSDFLMLSGVNGNNNIDFKGIEQKKDYSIRENLNFISSYIIKNFYDRIEMPHLLTELYEGIDSKNKVREIYETQQKSTLPKYKLPISDESYEVEITDESISAGGGVRRKRTNKRKYNTHVFTRKRKQNTRKITKSKLRKTRRM
jgi:hypothetical protein